MCGIWAIFGSDELPMHLCACLRIAHRGPDAFRMEQAHQLPRCCLGFHRLAIMDSRYGMQPLKIHALPHVWLIYNGEIYNFRRLGEEFGFDFETECDGEVLLHLYARGGVELMAKHLDGVFAFCLLDTQRGKVYVGRDTFGVRPAFRLRTGDGMMAICSEAKGLLDVVPSGNKYQIEPLKPGTYEEYDLTPAGYVTHRETVAFNTVGQPPAYKTLVEPNGDIFANVRDVFVGAVRKRMMAHRRIGCLLSGGLDSSLVTALVCKIAKEMELSYPIQTFSVGMAGSPDLAAAQKVADYLGTEHHEVVFTPKEGLDALKSVIYSLESYDITTIRASVGMYIVSKYITDNTDSRVIFSGEGADEVAQGYIYFHKQPSDAEGDEESRRLLKDLYYFDVLRADRTTAAHGLELRVPFLDHQFTSYLLSLPAEMRKPRGHTEKYLLRKAFSSMNLIPSHILWRPKEAFSDGVSSSQKLSWFELLQEHADKKVSDNELEEAPTTFAVNTPTTKESYLYRQIFTHHFPDSAHFLPYLWLPRWTGATDPSARTLGHYKTHIKEEISTQD